MSLTTSLDGFSSSVTEIKILERPLTQSVTLSLSPLLEGEEKDHTEEEGITKPLPRSQMSPVPVSNVPPWSTPMVNMDMVDMESNEDNDNEVNEDNDNEETTTTMKKQQ